MSGISRINNYTFQRIVVQWNYSSIKLTEHANHSILLLTPKHFRYLFHDHFIYGLVKTLWRLNMTMYQILLLCQWSLAHKMGVLHLYSALTVLWLLKLMWTSVIIQSVNGCVTTDNVEIQHSRLAQKTLTEFSLYSWTYANGLYFYKWENIWFTTLLLYIFCKYCFLYIKIQNI